MSTTNNNKPTPPEAADAARKPADPAAERAAEPAAEPAAGRAARPADKAARPRKERVLHTRVPDVLDRELKRLAESLRVPVSNVVRAILTDAVEAADAVGQRAEGEIRGVADRLNERRAQLRRDTADALRAGPPLAPPAPRAPAAPAPPAAGPPLQGIVGFQPLLLARPSACAVCGAALAAGSQAFLGITDQPGRATVVGPECLPFSHQPAAGSGAGEPS